ncbi:hypothetical protein KK062_28115 [Fulvivirgaceae bacterium PWU5]|uniref:Uncharacterized protein n=1 Tax=Dawidia cretensis TaxID=2782350 RepID=A0AAP2GTE1_9BACT|nr:hypothetical protein [Dawidia cretensis]MBT1712139.1 hypothetical protein [Dawidia cretensis]
MIFKVLKVLAILFGVALQALVGVIIFTAYVFRDFDSTPPRTKEHLGRWYKNSISYTRIRPSFAWQRTWSI